MSSRLILLLPAKTLLNRRVKGQFLNAPLYDNAAWFTDESILLAFDSAIAYEKASIRMCENK